ncbi:hypothetical protein NESM_000062800 [Novymonas esmeraldas]|uniref:Uncharacterized protein n=1 Tax=Novymonas esmeraldas TaxID=1808958 RepID=A0AAW0F1Q8_9TRYP
MRRGEQHPRRQVRLVQPFEDGGEGGERGWDHRPVSTTVRAATPLDRPASSSVASLLTPIQLPRSRAGVEVDAGCTSSLNTTQPLTSCSSSPAVLPPCPARKDSLSEVAASPPSTDRLAALYRQYQITQDDGAHASRSRGGAGRTRDSAAAAVSRRAASSRPPVQTSRDEAGDAPPRRHVAAGGDSPPPVCPSRFPSTDERALPTPPHDDPGRGATTRRTLDSLRTPAPASESADASRVSSHGQPARATVVLPARMSATGIPALMHVAVQVWAVLGFLEMRSAEATATSAAEAGEMERCAAGPSRPEDAESFLWGLEEFLRFYDADLPGPSSAVLVDTTALVRNGLWRVLFNAVFYCLSVLDRHRRRRGPLPRREAEVCTGGVEDAYEVVYPSSTSSDAGEEASVARDAPVRLLWKHPGESDEEQRTRCVRPALPPDSPLWSVLPPSTSAPAADPTSADRLSRSPHALADVYGGRLRSALRIADWYLVLRCLAQVGYRRDAFYLQTPFHASPYELLLALLWLTQQYKLLAVAEYVELNRRYAFLLQYHVCASFRGGGGETRPAQTTARERLVYRLAHASAWPPVSFDENATITHRLAQLERCLGRPTSPTAHTVAGASAAALHVRRLMATRRLLSLSFNRLHQALQRQAEHVALLGLHSPLDAQLCRKEHHALYEEVVAGLTYVQATEQRLRTAAGCLGAAGSLVAFLLRYEESTVPAEEVLLALEEDDTTWLSGGGGGSGGGAEARSRKTTDAERWRRAVRRGTLPTPQTAPQSSASPPLAPSAATLAESLATFRTTHARATLTETWKRLLRRSHVSPQTVPPESLRFLLDTEAQQMQEARVWENMKARYSLQATLAAEVAVLGYETLQRHQRRRSHSRSPSRDGADDRWARAVEESVDATVRPVQVALPPLDLVTSAGAAFAHLRAEEAAYGPVALGSAEMQLTEVGEPAAGSTTSARLELERLEEWEAQLDGQLNVPAQTAARVEYCKGVLQALYRQHGLRLATPVSKATVGQQERVSGGV